MFVVATIAETPFHGNVREGDTDRAIVKHLVRKPTPAEYTDSLKSLDPAPNDRTIPTTGDAPAHGRNGTAETSHLQVDAARNARLVPALECPSLISKFGI